MAQFGRELLAAIGAAAVENTLQRAQASGVTIRVKTNVTPELVLYDAAQTGPTFFDLLGIKFQIRAETADGKEIARYGDDVSVNPLLAGAYWSALALGVVLIGATIVRVIRR